MYEALYVALIRLAMRCNFSYFLPSYLPPPTCYEAVLSLKNIVFFLLVSTLDKLFLIVALFVRNDIKLDRLNWLEHLTT